jgi:histone acetyltransferase (RNA polymerase elongator complex component)
VAEGIKNYLRTIPKGCVVEVAFYGGSFTGLPIELQEELLKPAYQAYSEGLINGIRISTRPDLIDPVVLKYIKKWGVGTIELGVQSLNQEVLTASGRGHTPEDVVRSVELIQEAGLILGLQMMIGLPKDTRERSVATGLGIIGLHPNFIRIYPTIVICGTLLHRIFQKGDYWPLSLDEAIDWTRLLFLMFASHDIPVIRMGLQASESLLKPGEVVAGPFHSAFGELVESAVALEQVETLLRKWSCQREYLGTKSVTSSFIEPEKLILVINPRYWSRIVGQHKSNIQKIMSRWNVSLLIRGDESLPIRDICLKTYSDQFENYLNWQEFLTSCRISY